MEVGYEVGGAARHINLVADVLDVGGLVVGVERELCLQVGTGGVPQGHRGAAHLGKAAVGSEKLLILYRVRVGEARAALRSEVEGGVALVDDIAERLAHDDIVALLHHHQLVDGVVHDDGERDRLVARGEHGAQGKGCLAQTRDDGLCTVGADDVPVRRKVEYVVQCRSGREGDMLLEPRIHIGHRGGEVEERLRGAELIDIVEYAQMERALYRRVGRGRDGDLRLACTQATVLTHDGAVAV